MTRYLKVAKCGDLQPWTGKTVSVNGFNMYGSHHAIDNTCPHEDGPLGEGALCGRIVSCPVHAYEFDVTNGTA